MARANVVMFMTGLLLAVAPPALGQTVDPMSRSAAAQFAVVNGFVQRSAAKVPEGLFSYQPTPQVRTFAQLFGHIADAYFEMCATAAGVAPPRSGIESGNLSQSALIAALEEGASFCRSVMEGMTDDRGAETVSFYFGDTPRLGVLFFVSTHTYEHYGNLVTYMRINDIVPPSSE